MNIARERPSVRALACCCGGSLPDRMAMKTMLSMPSTISRAVRVRRAIQASGEKISPLLTGRGWGLRDAVRSFFGRDAVGVVDQGSMRRRDGAVQERVGGAAHPAVETVAHFGEGAVGAGSAARLYCSLGSKMRL